MSTVPQSSKTVLVLDDEPSFNLLLQELFGTTPYSVIAESDPLKALNIVQERKIDLVVTDHQMPGLTGAEFIHKARSYRPDLLFIMVSGCLDASVTREMIDAGIGGIFLKPVDMKGLLRCADSLLEGDHTKPRLSGVHLARFN
jgi:CheY-like chemotaxis protein